MYMPMAVAEKVVNLKVDVAVPFLGRVIVEGLKVEPGSKGVTVSLRLNVPSNPLTLVTVIMEELAEPATTAREDVFEETEKSGPGTTSIVIVTEWTRAPLLPNTVTS